MHIHSLPGSLSWPKCIHFKSPVPISKDCLSTFPHQSFNWSDPFMPFHKKLQVRVQWLCLPCMLPASPNLSMILSAVKRGSHKCPYYDTICTFPSLPLPQIQMFSKLPFTSCERHVGRKGLLCQGKDLLRSDPSTKSSRRFSSFLVTPTTKTFLLLTLPLSVWKFSNKVLFVVPMARLAYIRF